jgi:hypothetical protein
MDGWQNRSCGQDKYLGVVGLALVFGLGVAISR